MAMAKASTRRLSLTRTLAKWVCMDTITEMTSLKVDMEMEMDVEMDVAMDVDTHTTRPTTTTKKSHHSTNQPRNPRPNTQVRSRPPNNGPTNPAPQICSKSQQDPEKRLVLRGWSKKRTSYFNNFTPNNDNNDNSADEQAQDDENLRFAYYQVDYHIHLHDRARCNMLTLCRDIDDVRQLRGWEAEMEVLSMGMDLRMDMGLDLGVDTEKPGRCTYDNDGEDDSNPHVHERKETREMWRRGKEDELFRVHQMGLWRRRWRMRQKRVEGVRREWVVLLAKRRRQRKEMLREMQRRRANVRFYGSKAGGDRVLLREVQM